MGGGGGGVCFFASGDFCFVVANFSRCCLVEGVLSFSSSPLFLNLI